MKEIIEQQIRQLLLVDTKASVLSNVLFSPGGLFSQLAHSEEERRTISQSPLFKQAQARVSELSRIEADELRKATERVQAVMSSAIASSPEKERAEMPPLSEAVNDHPASLHPELTARVDK